MVFSQKLTDSISANDDTIRNIDLLAIYHSVGSTETAHLTMKSGHALTEFSDMVGIARKSGARYMCVCVCVCANI